MIIISFDCNSNQDGFVTNPRKLAGKQKLFFLFLKFHKVTLEIAFYFALLPVLNLFLVSHGKKEKYITSTNIFCMAFSKLQRVQI